MPSIINLVLVMLLPLYISRAGENDSRLLLPRKLSKHESNSDFPSEYKKGEYSLFPSEYSLSVWVDNVMLWCLYKH